MKTLDLTGIDLADSPDDPTRARLSAQLSIDGRAADQRLWIELEREHAETLTTSGDPWLMALLALAAETGRALTIDAPVDRRLYENAHELQRYWHRCGFTPQRLISLNVAGFSGAAIQPADSERAGRTGLFFSGGVDSLFSLMSDTPEYYPERSWRVDDLIHVWGFDVALDRRDAFEREDAVRQAIADATARTLVRARTNIRATMMQGRSWGWVHPMFLVAMGLALAGRYRRLLVAGDRDYTNIKPGGFNRIAAHYWSSSRVEFAVDSGEHTRFEKLDILTGTDVGRSMLKVCTDPSAEDYLNCGRCVKCLRTMAALDLMGKLDVVTVFDRRYYPAAIAAVEPVRAGPSDFSALPKMARAAKRRDLARLLDGYRRRYERKYLTRRQRLEATLSESVVPARLARRIGQVVEWGYARLRGNAVSG